MIERPGLARVRWIGLSVIVVANGLALGNAAYNRMGEPESRLVVSQRELWVDAETRRESSGVSAHLRWCVTDSVVVADDPGREYPGLDCDNRMPDWLNQQRLAALGFDVQLDAETADAARRSYRSTVRRAFLVLELGGTQRDDKLARARALLANREAAFGRESDTARVRREIANMRARVDYLERSASRLYVIDAGPDREALRAKYPDRSRYAILTGKVRARVRTGDSAAPHRVWVGGELSAVDGERLNVPNAYQGALLAVTPQGRFGRRPATGQERVLQITVPVGRRLEPWIAGVK
jgi:hypothetical protein